jgi:hypothetical protein
LGEGEVQSPCLAVRDLRKIAKTFPSNLQIALIQPLNLPVQIQTTGAKNVFIRSTVNIFDTSTNYMVITDICSLSLTNHVVGKTFFMPLCEVTTDFSFTSWSRCNNGRLPQPNGVVLVSSPAWDPYQILTYKETLRSSFLLLLLVGWDLRHQVLRPLLTYCTAPNDR